MFRECFAALATLRGCFAGVTLPTIECFEAYAGATHPNIECFTALATLCECYAVYIGCFETLEAYTGAMHPNIECFKALNWCYAACNLVSRNTKLVLHRLLLECF